MIQNINVWIQLALLNAMSLFEKQQSGENTHCSFVFENPTEDGESTEKKIIHGNRIILSAVSPFFEAAFKGEWKGDKPIPITTFEFGVFDKFVKAIYVGKCKFRNLNEMSDLYAAAHFYQTESLLDLLRDEIIRYFYDRRLFNIAPVVDIALKYQDFKLMGFSSKFFSKYGNHIIDQEYFSTFSFDAINFLYQIGELKVDEHQLLTALEKVVQERGPESIKKLKPAIGSIRFLAIPDRINNTNLLTRTEKDYLIGNKIDNFIYLSKDKNKRSI